jgi:hypothetical protein
MAVIRIERVPVSVGGLGLLGFDHLQLVLQQDDYDPRLRQDNWYVMEGVRESGADGFVLGVEGGNGVTTLSAANGLNRFRAHGRNRHRRTTRQPRAADL